MFKATVSVLINFDFPSNLTNYYKRTNDLSSSANAGMTILNLVLETDTKLLNRLNKRLARKEKPALEPLNLKMDNFERFRYRC